MEDDLSENRSSCRLTPLKPVTVALRGEELSLAYGVVTNIPETGACVWKEFTWKKTYPSSNM